MVDQRRIAMVRKETQQQLLSTGIVSRRISMSRLFTLEGQNFVFCPFLICNPKWSLIVYRLIGAALIENFPIILFKFKIEILYIRRKFAALDS